jgi:hypothetical protein
MKIPVRDLRKIVENPSRYYKPPRLEAINGKVRELNVPVWRFMCLLRRLHRFVQSRFPAHRSVHGGVKGKSCFTAAAAHCGKSFVVSRDIQDCYPSITSDALKRRLLGLGFRSDTAWYLTRLMTHRDQIPQGSPTSGDALNLFLYDGDEKVAERFGGRGAATRSADDWVVTPRGGGMTEEEAARILETQIEEHGLRVSERKRAKSGLQKSNKLQLVHNIVVNSAGGTGINPEFTGRAIEAGVGYVRAARRVSAETLIQVAQLREKVHGWTYYCRQAHFGPARYVYRLLRTGDRLVSNRLFKAGVTRSRRWWKSSVRGELARRWCDLVETQRGVAAPGLRTFADAGAPF